MSDAAPEATPEHAASAAENVGKPAPPASARGPLVAAAVVTALVTALSYAVPDSHAATAVGLAFLGATYLLVLRGDEEQIRASGLSLGGVLEPERLSVARLARAFLRASAWALAFFAFVAPPFWLGYKLYFRPRRHFFLTRPTSVLDDVAGQLLVVALPEEAFYRGYLQSALDRVWAPTWSIFGAKLGPGWLVSSAIFAVGHVLTSPHPSRLAVFFPSLVFGWLRARTGGIGAAALFHALCNLLSSTLARGYGFSG